MSFTVNNPATDRPWYGNAFGTWYEIAPGGSIEIESGEVASCLGAMGAVLSTEEARAAAVLANRPAETEADVAARAIAQEANAKTASVPASVADEVASKRDQQITTGPEVGAGVVELKGAALDDALKAAGLPTTGKAEDKRDRYAAWVAEQGGTSTDVADLPGHVDEVISAQEGELIAETGDDPTEGEAGQQPDQS